MTKTILAVDDNPTNLKLVRIVLEEAGYEVIVANDGMEARRILGTLHVDLVLMDIQMPVITGLDLTRELRADPRHRTLKIVALTAAAMAGDEEKARAAGCDGYITKPIDTASLPDVVASYLTA